MNLSGRRKTENFQWNFGTVRLTIPGTCSVKRINVLTHCNPAPLFAPGRKYLITVIITISRQKWTAAYKIEAPSAVSLINRHSDEWDPEISPVTLNHRRGRPQRDRNQRELRLMRGPVTVLFTNRSCGRETTGNFAGKYLTAGGVHARQFREHVKPLFPLIARGTRENIGAIHIFVRVSIICECVITFFHRNQSPFVARGIKKLRKTAGSRG